MIKCTEGTDLVGSISIGKNCFIGMNSVLLPGVSIADNCIVGAGSIVTKSVTEESVVVAGNPARRICEVSEYAEKNNENIFNFKGVKRCEKKHLILNNPDKWVRR